MTTGPFVQVYMVEGEVHYDNVRLLQVCESSGDIDYYSQVLKSTFQKVSGHKLPKTPKPLGKGTRGVAYDIGGGLILKITRDASEAKASSLIVGKKYRGIWEVEGVWHAESEELAGLYFIVGEKLVHKMDRQVKIRQEFSGGFGDSKIWTDEFLKDYFKEQSPTRDFKEIAYGLNNLYNLDIDWDDMKLGNVMFSGDKAVILDLGYSHSGSGNIEEF